MPTHDLKGNFGWTMTRYKTHIFDISWYFLQSLPKQIQMCCNKSIYIITIICMDHLLSIILLRKISATSGHLKMITNWKVSLLIFFSEIQRKGTERRQKECTIDESSEFKMEVWVLKLGIRYLSRMRGNIRIMTHWCWCIHVIEMALTWMRVRIIILIPFLIMWNWAVRDWILRLHVLKM